MAFPARVKPRDSATAYLASARKPMRALLSQVCPAGILIRLVSGNLLQSAHHHCDAARQVRPQSLGEPGDTNVRSILRLGSCPICGLATKEPPMVCSSARSDRTILPLAAQRHRAKIIERKAWRGEAPFTQDRLDWHPRPLRTRRQ